MRAVRFRQPAMTRITPHPQGAGILIGAKRPSPYLFTANPDSYTIGAGLTLTVLVAQGVLANDNTASGATPITALLAQNVTAGTLLLAVDGSFTYTAPATPQVQTFRYWAVDNNGRRSQHVPVTITVT